MNNCIERMDHDGGVKKQRRCTHSMPKLALRRPLSRERKAATLLPRRSLRCSKHSDNQAHANMCVMYVYSHTNTKRTAKGTLNDHGMYLDPNFSSCQRSNGTHELTRRFFICCAAKERLGTKLRSRCKTTHMRSRLSHTCSKCPGKPSSEKAAACDPSPTLLDASESGLPLPSTPRRS